MTVGDVAEKLNVEIKVSGDTDKMVSGCCVSDLLSDVLANSNEGDLWITHQSHPNVVAVTSVRGLAGVLITGNRNVDSDTLKKAEQEKVNVLSTGLSSFEVAGEIYSLLKS